MSRPFSILAALVLACSIACGGSPKQAVVSSPTPDSVTRNYVNLARTFWSDIETADEVSIGNVAAKACLQLIDPPTCRDRAIALLAAQQKFLSGLDSTPAPPEFTAEDKIFRSQIPKTIADLKALISAADTGSKDAVLQAAMTYVNDMIPTVTGAMDHVDPSVVHD
jgi:hypothetical protein